MPQNNDIKERMTGERDRKEIAQVFGITIVLELLLLAAVLGLTMILDLFETQNEFLLTFQQYAPSLIGIGFAVIIIRLILGLIKVAINRIVRRYKGAEGPGKMAWRIISYTIWLFVALAVLLVFFENIWTYMVGVAVITAAIIYALATPLQNIAGWFLIVMVRPFRIGDIIDMGGVRGYVFDMSLSSTMIREMGNWVGGDLYTGRSVTVPNRMVFETGVANYTRNNKFVYDYLTFNITYESDVKKAEEILLGTTNSLLGSSDETFMKAARDIETKELIYQMPKEARVFWNAQDSGVELGIMYIVSMNRRFVMRSEITKQFLDAISEEASVSIAYPHMELVRHGKE